MTTVANGAMTTLATNYVSGIGTAGADTTAQVVKTITLAANRMDEVGDRLRVRCYWRGDTGVSITGTMTLNGVTIAATTDVGLATVQLNEAWLHYIDGTHANLISMSGGVLDTTLSITNLAGFAWTTAQDVSLAQSSASGNHIIVFFLAVDIFPKGVF